MMTCRRLTYQHSERKVLDNENLALLYLCDIFAQVYLSHSNLSESAFHRFLPPQTRPGSSPRMHQPPVCLGQHFFSSPDSSAERSDLSPSCASSRGIVVHVGHNTEPAMVFTPNILVIIRSYPRDDGLQSLLSLVQLHPWIGVPLPMTAASAEIYCNNTTLVVSVPLSIRLNIFATQVVCGSKPPPPPGRRQTCRANAPIYARPAPTWSWA